MKLRGFMKKNNNLVNCIDCIRFRKYFNLIILYYYCLPFLRLTTSIFFIFLFFDTSINAQIIPDSTLGTESSKVNLDVSTKEEFNSVISEGALRGTNLFHSFEQFSVPTGGTAYFNNAPNIQNIISRVTGKSISEIDGLIRANGSANLFLINPNGIIFGPNARLNLGGSFLASTASSLKLADGTEFTATSSQAKPLLTVNVPVGLQFSALSGAITVHGNGSNLELLRDVAPQPLAKIGNSLNGLRLQPGKTLALVGNGVRFQGGTVTAPSGNIEIGSINSGLVDITTFPQGWSLNYSRADSFSDIEILRLSLVDVSGLGRGDIQLVGKNINLFDGSYILNQNQGILPTGSIDITATQSLNLVGARANSFLRSGSASEASSGIYSQTFFAKGANINIFTPNMLIQNGGSISLTTFGEGAGGDVYIDAPESIQISGVSPLDPLIGLSGIGTTTSASGSAGNLSISTKFLSLLDGGIITSLTFGNGIGGNVTINALDSIKIEGVVPNTLLSSFIASTNFGSNKAGNLEINTSDLTLQNRGAIDSSTASGGGAGSVTINASNSVRILGGSNISSAASPVDETFQTTYGVFADLSGASGDIRIRTGDLIVDNSVISVINEGSGEAGNLSLSTRLLKLNQGILNAQSSAGNGGNITLKTQDLQLQSNSKVTATSGTIGGIGNGGNINIDSDLLLSSEGSAIEANAFEGQGGNIRINTRGIFLSPDSSITASSEQGIDGIVEINQLVANPAAQLIVLPSEVVDKSNLIAQSCPADVASDESSLVFVGRGGLPEDPTQPITPSTLWTDLSLLTEEPPQISEPVNRESTKPANPTNSAGTVLVPATGWKRDRDGNLIFTAENPATIEIPWVNPTCHASSL